MLSATSVTVEPFNEKPLPIAMSVPVVAVPVNDKPFVPVRFAFTVTDVPCNVIDDAVVADDEVAIVPVVVTFTFIPDANVPSVTPVELPS